MRLMRKFFMTATLLLAAGVAMAGIAACGGVGVGRLRLGESYQAAAPITTAAVAIPSAAAATE